MLGTGVTWDCYIAEKLGKSLEQVGAMSQIEYDIWLEYFNVKAVLRDLAIRTENSRGDS